jgi:hypothetical protein
MKEVCLKLHTKDPSPRRSDVDDHEKVLLEVDLAGSQSRLALGT